MIDNPAPTQIELSIDSLGFSLPSSSLPRRLRHSIRLIPRSRHSLLLAKASSVLTAPIMPEKQPERIHIASGADLAAHFDSIHQDLAQQETEHTWQKLDRALLKLEAVTKGGGYKFDDFVPQMKAVAGPLARSVSPATA